MVYLKQILNFLTTSQKKPTFAAQTLMGYVQVHRHAAALPLPKRAEGAAAVDRWLNVLKTGGKLKPLELLKLAGVDMSSPALIHEAVAYVCCLIMELG